MFMVYPRRSRTYSTPRRRVRSWLLPPWRRICRRWSCQISYGLSIWRCCTC